MASLRLTFPFETDRVCHSCNCYIHQTIAKSNNPNGHAGLQYQICYSCNIFVCWADTEQYTKEQLKDVQFTDPIIRSSNRATPTTQVVEAPETPRFPPRIISDYSEDSRKKVRQPSPSIVITNADRENPSKTSSLGPSKHKKPLVFRTPPRKQTPEPSDRNEETPEMEFHNKNEEMDMDADETSFQVKVNLTKVWTDKTEYDAKTEMAICSLHPPSANRDFLQQRLAINDQHFNQVLNLANKPRYRPYSKTFSRRKNGKD